MFLDFGCEYRQLLVAFAGQSEMLMTQELYRHLRHMFSNSYDTRG